jgi:RimJ/RimL family protein N-acetyltransferase
MGLSAPEMAQPRGTISKPLVLTLKDGSQATLFPFYHKDLNTQKLPSSLVQFLYEEFNVEIERGDTYPYLNTLSKQEFEDYWFCAFTAVLIDGVDITLSEDIDWSQKVLGTYYIKPNYIGRCSHICNAGFLVNPRLRGKSVGKTLGKSYLQWAPILGYSYSVFNLVFATNVASVKIWDSLGFSRIGLVKNAGVLKGHDEPVDAIIFGKDLV